MPGKGFARKRWILEARGRPRKGQRGSVLLLSLLLCSLLSVLVLGAAGSMILARRTERSLAESMESFYLAEAGLAHARAYCRSVAAWPSPPAEVPADGETVAEPPGQEAPVDQWLSWGPGKYWLQAVVLPDNPSPPASFPERGIVVRVTAAIGDRRKKKLQTLFDEPPSCRTLAWWEPD